MRIKLLLFFFTATIAVIAQTPINNYFSLPMSQFAIVSGTINQTATGPNAVWSFGTVIQAGTNTDTFSAPTATQLTNYPGTTQVLLITDNVMNTSQGFYKTQGAMLFLTGASNTEFNLDYNTDNAFLGTYPLAYGSAAVVDAIAGTINAQGQSATYTGTITTQVDAYGVLSFEVPDLGAYNGNVTRIKSEQSINFSLFGVLLGTANIINYNYYKNEDKALVFRTSEGEISVPGAGINESFSSAEGLITNTLSINNLTINENAIKIYPNPSEALIHIKSNSNLAIQSVKIIDVNGKTILTVNNSSTAINVKDLQLGFYTIVIETENGLVFKKFIKK